MRDSRVSRGDVRSGQLDRSFQGELGDHGVGRGSGAAVNVAVPVVAPVGLVRVGGARSDRAVLGCVMGVARVHTKGVVDNFFHEVDEEESA